MDHKHESYSFDNIYDATTWLEHVVEELNDSEYYIVEARVVWVNHQWKAGYTATKQQMEFTFERTESEE